MIIVKCHHCGLPVMIHFAWCYTSGVRTEVMAHSLREGAIIKWRGEARIKPLPADKQAKMENG